MNESLQDRLDQLTIELKKRRVQYHTSLRHLVYLSVIILVFFSLYSAILSWKIREIATPSTIALLIAGQLREQFTNELESDRLNFRRTARDMTQSALVALPVGIHASGEFLRDLMRQDAEYAALNLSHSLTPLLQKSLEPLLSGGELPVEAAPQAERILKSVPYLQAEKSCRTLMFPMPLAVGERLREIRMKKDGALTRQDLCDRDFMLCWLYLNDRERYRDSRYSVPLMRLTGLIFPCGNDPEQPALPIRQNSTKNSPIANSAPVRQ